MVDNGDVRIGDLVGNNGADAAADLGSYGNKIMSSLLDVTFFGFVATGTPLYLISISSWLLSHVLR